MAAFAGTGKDRNSCPNLCLSSASAPIVVSVQRIKPFWAYILDSTAVQIGDSWLLSSTNPVA